jgi:hypothetical protein
MKSTLEGPETFLAHFGAKKVPFPPSIQAFKQNKLEINSNMKSA